MKTNRLELIKTLDKNANRKNNEWNVEKLHNVSVVIDNEHWGNVAILETWNSDLGSVYCTVGDWQTKQPSTIKEFYNIAKWAGVIYLDTDKKLGTATDPITNIIYDASDIV